ncbi:hypothetical protein HJ590_02015 [Naumannella sp. ID2617S]|nr:hypothetical protein [Naumannella sp. ID2617S]
MKHLWAVLLGGLSTAAAFLALRLWTVAISTPAAPGGQLAVPLFSFAPIRATLFVVSVATAAILAEACVATSGRPRHRLVRIITLAAGVAALLAWGLAYGAQLGLVRSRLSGLPQLPGCSAGEQGCPGYVIGDGAAIARAGVALIVCTVLHACVRWSIALLGGALALTVLSFGPHVAGHSVSPQGVNEVWSWPPTQLLGLVVVLALLLWWALGILIRPTWWWFVVSLVIWAAILALGVTFTSDRAEHLAAVQAAEGMGVAGDLDWAYPVFAIAFLLCPVALLITWLTDRRRKRPVPESQPVV